MITRAPAELKTLLGFIVDFENMNENIYLQRSSLRLKFCVKEPRDWKVFGVGVSLTRKPFRGRGHVQKCFIIMFLSHKVMGFKGQRMVMNHNSFLILSWSHGGKIIKMGH